MIQEETLKKFSTLLQLQNPGNTLVKSSVGIFILIHLQKQVFLENIKINSTFCPSTHCMTIQIPVEVLQMH